MRTRKARRSSATPRRTFWRRRSSASTPKDVYKRQAEYQLLRLCDVHNVPVATNIATAEVLICAVERGDLNWRE